MLQLEDQAVDDAVIVVPSGRLDIGTYWQLRDHLIKVGADTPRAVIVDLSELGLESGALLSIFPAVHTRLQLWPGVPLLLANGTTDVRRLLALYRTGRYLPVHDSVSQAMAAIDDPPPRRLAWLQLPNSLTSPRIARRFAWETATAWGLEENVDDAVLLLGELVTNAVVHTLASPDIRLELRRNLLSVAVYDDVPGEVSMLDPGGGAGLHGLLLVAQLSAAWGCSPTSSGGKAVWATLRTR